ncbi:tetratricopeptide repeat protein [Porphyromonas sp.]|uniref:tetratricopeptide repeat protein n=1 Tax=Porphyromonas sp. TaxID=1924944 RepID=UPI0026DC0E83|nr:tetratricopeptide repeat protein [Porphyromonas sp.]MDO4695692.1 hypothetical protein [Porphyromonas sp.]MDO4771713.1 hypothetical protein [Porphyromonas sp.]
MQDLGWGRIAFSPILTFLCVCATFAQSNITSPHFEELLSQRLYLKSLVLDDVNNEEESGRFNHLWMASLGGEAQSSILHQLSVGLVAIGRPGDALVTMQKAYTLSVEDQEIGRALIDIASRMGRLDIAENTLQSLIKFHPEEKLLYTQLVEVYKQKGDMNLALETLDKLLAMDHTLNILIHEKAKILMEMDRREEAIKILEKQVNDVPLDLESLSALISVYLSMGKISEAKAIFSKAKKVVNDYTLLSDLGVYIYLAEEDYERAAKEILRAARTEDAVPQIIEELMSRSLSVSHDKIAMTKALIPVQEELSVVYEQSSGIKLLLASNYLLVGDTLKGEQLLQRLIDEKVVDPYPYTYFTEKYIRSKDTSKMLDMAKKGISVFPNKGVFYVYALMAYGELGDKESSAILLEDAVRLVQKNDSDYGDIILIKADLEAEAGRYDTARDLYEVAIQHAKTPLALNNYAYFLAVHGTPADLDKAEELASRAVRVVRNFPTFLDTYAWVLYLKGEYTLAKIYIENAIRNEELPNAVYHEHYGDILYKLGELEGAVKAFEKAIELGGDAESITPKINNIKVLKNDQ